MHHLGMSIDTGMGMTQERCHWSAKNLFLGKVLAMRWIQKVSVKSRSSTDESDLLPFRIGSDTWRIDLDTVRVSAVNRLAVLEISASQDGSLVSYILVRFPAGRRRKLGGTEVINNLRTHVL